GLDVHKASVTACVRLQGDRGKLEKYLRRFGTMIADLRALAAWLIELRVTHVAMESTGVYWKPVWDILEGNFTLLLANAQKRCRPARMIRKMQNGWPNSCSMACYPAASSRPGRFVICGT